MPVAFPNETSEYRAARNRLLEQEIELRRSLEAVAKARRELPQGGALPEDYVFEGATGKVKLSELFGHHDTLAIYSYMFGPERKSPCPMCTPLLDAITRGQKNLDQRLSFVIVAEAPIAKLLDWARHRGWSEVPLVSAGGTTYNRDYHGRNSEGQDSTMMNVFRRQGGKVFHFWGSEMAYAEVDPGQDMRHTDLLNPNFMMFDLTPEGRGDFYTKLDYPNR